MKDYKICDTYFRRLTLKEKILGVLFIMLLFCIVSAIFILVILAIPATIIILYMIGVAYGVYVMTLIILGKLWIKRAENIEVRKKIDEEWW